MRVGVQRLESMVGYAKRCDAASMQSAADRPSEMMDESARFDCVWERANGLKALKRSEAALELKGTLANTRL